MLIVNICKNVDTKDLLNSKIIFYLFWLYLHPKTINYTKYYQSHFKHRYYSY